MSHEDKVKGAKIKIAVAAREGIEKMLRSPHGIESFGNHANACQCLDSLRTIQVDVEVEGILHVFELTVRELLAS